MRKVNHKHWQHGFTIIELMIAITVLSIILVMATAIMLNISNLFYKGLNQSRVQDDTRTIADDVAEHLQLGKSVQYLAATNPLAPTQGGFKVGVLCVDNTRYSFILGNQINTAHHVLWRDTLQDSKPCVPALLTVADPKGTNGGDWNQPGAELIAPNSRLSQFTLSSIASPYTINVSVVYGDDTVLDPLTKNLPTAHCAGGNENGDRFCAESSLSTTIDKRKS